MENATDTKGGASRAGEDAAQSPFLTRHMFYGIAISCVLGLGLGAWARPPISQSLPTDTIQPQMVQSQFANTASATADQSSYWQVSSAFGNNASAVPTGGQTQAPEPAVRLEPVADRHTERAPPPWRAAQADFAPPPEDLDPPDGAPVPDNDSVDGPPSDAAGMASGERP